MKKKKLNTKPKKTLNNKKDKSIESKLWDTAEKLRGSVEPSEYKHIVLSLIFLKFISDFYERKREELIKEGKKKYINIPEFYQKDSLFYLPEKCTWKYIVTNSKQSNIALIIGFSFRVLDLTLLLIDFTILSLLSLFFFFLLIVYLTSFFSDEASSFAAFLSAGV